MANIKITHTKALPKSSNPNEDRTLDREKEELFPLRRLLAFHHNAGGYEKALKIGLELQEKITEIYGTNNTVYASCLSNIALMQKMLGNYDSAMKTYTDALQIYFNLQGKETSSYATTLSNLGTLYKIMATQNKGMEKLQLLERSKEALTDAFEIRQRLFGPVNKETLTSKILLSSLLNVEDKYAESMVILEDCLLKAIDQFGKEDLLVATVQNNLGYVHKQLKEYSKAESCYKIAHTIRSKILGESHAETIVCLYNLAESYLASAEEKKAHAIQNSIISLLESKKSTSVVSEETPQSDPNASPSIAIENNRASPKVLSTPPHMKPLTRKKTK